jgi:hypothetical protein
MLCRVVSWLVPRRHGRKVGQVGKGGRVEHVDSRLKKDKKKARIAEKKGGSRKRTSSAGGKKRYKRR